MEKTEYWERTEEPVILPEDLEKDPNKYGGLSHHMVISVQKQIVTVPVHCGGVHVCIPVCADDAKRICEDGGVDIANDRYWCSIHDATVFFKGTDEKINLIRGLF